MKIGTEGQKPMEVLLCEDSPGDVRLTREAFHVANETVNLHVVADGVEAMAYLKSEHDHCPRPDLILLDLNMPRMGGREVLAHLKTDDCFKTIPVVILTNGGTASAAEIVAGALHDRGRATLVGSKTFGKGTVQQWTQLEDDSGGFRLTIAKWLTPDKTWVHKAGIEPDVTVDATGAAPGEDPALDAALEVLGAQTTGTP